jgi:MYXO-CTERM domain-containing protein
MSRRDRAWEWFLEACSWAVVPLIVVGLVALVAIEARRRRRAR